MAVRKTVFETFRPTNQSDWWAQWRLEFCFDPCWWVVGFHFFPGWRFTICLGPLGVELVKAKVHI